MKPGSPNRKNRKSSLLEKLFGSTSRERILSLLLGQPHKSFYQREIMFETGQSLQAIQRELGNLVDIGIVKQTETGNRVYYQVDDTSFLFKPLKEIFLYD
jgi:predicted transcriptional regulator